MEAENVVWHFRVDGAPIPDRRPRAGRNGSIYMDPTVRAWRKAIASAARRTGARIGGSCEVRMIFDLPFSARRRAEDPATMPPDIDNLAKLVLDGMQDGGVFVYGDDQVVDLRATKGYSEVPGVSVLLRPLQPPSTRNPRRKERKIPVSMDAEEVW